MKGFPVDVIITYRQIHAFTPVNVTIYAPQPFSVKRWKGRLIRIYRGISETWGKGKGVRAVDDPGGMKVVEMEIEGWTRVIYDVHFYPYMLGIVEGFIEIPGGFVRKIEFRLPPDLRTIWFLSNIAYGSAGISDPKVHSPERDWIRYFYYFKTNFQDINDFVKIRVVVRLAGAELLRLITIPVLYMIVLALLLALITIFTNVGTEIPFGVLTGYVLFLIQRLRDTTLPQRQTLLLYFYTILGVALTTWTIVWLLAGQKGLLLMPFYLYGIYQFWKLHTNFGVTGKLPEWLEAHVYRSIHRAEIHRKNSAKSSPWR